jgi:hypothetical protein
MRGAQLLTNHCPRIGLSLLVALGVMLSSSISAQIANAANAHELERGAADNIRNKVTANWNLPPDLPGMKDVHIQIHLKLDRSGRILGEPDVAARGGPEETRKIVAASAVRAVRRAAPFQNLPQTQFDNETSSVEVILNFEPGDMAL